MTIKPFVTVDVASFSRLEAAARRKAAEAAWKQQERAAQVMLSTVNEAVRRDFVYDRSPHRRKKGTTKLINSFTTRVDGTRGRFPVKAVLTIKPGVNAKKIAALNYGTNKTYTINPRNSPKLRFPKAGGKNAKWGNPKFLNAYGENNRAVLTVSREPFDGKHFMEEARDAGARSFG